tara:strand:+ start:1405 stop:1656 length:252 start_codon:yes stop_codon:yes gene_type:complete
MPEPKVAQKSPYVLDMEPGTYIWCGCGLSKDQPFCDNAHKGTEFEGTDQAALSVEIEEEGKKPWCGCKKTKTPPWCDGAHASL